MRFTPFVQRTFNAHARQSFVLARYGMVPSSRTSAAWIGRRDELRRHLARRSAGGVIQRRQILSNRPARVRSKLVDAPRFAGRGALAHPAFKNGDGFILHRDATKNLLSWF